MMMLLLLWFEVALAAPILSPQITGDEKFGENYTLVTKLDDGSFVLFQILFSNVGFGDGGGGCRMLYVPKDQTGINRRMQFDSDEWNYQTSSDQLTAGSCSIRQDGAVYFSGNIDDLQIELTATEELVRNRFPGEVDVSGELFHSEVLLANAPINGIVTHANQRFSVSGRAYMDHTRSDVILKDKGTVWIRYRGFYGEEPVLFQVYKDLSQKHNSWIWREGESSPSTFQQSIQFNHVSPDSIKVTLGDIQIQSSSKIYVFRPTEDYGLIGSFAKSIIGDLSTHTFDAKAVSNGETVSEGVLEVTFIK
jgi:hypothetical protein